jgi:SAM-dependent methyltransferase
VEKQWLFDRKWTQDFTRVRQEFMGEFLQQTRGEHGVRTALDLGCGVGYFSIFLRNLGLDVLGVDGRAENTVEASRRYPGINFLCRDIEDPQTIQIGTFDFVCCIGLLYHLENPFRAIRNVFALTVKFVLIETMSTPGANATMDLLDEGVGEDQGLNYVAFYPSEACLVKMLYRAGFRFVYQFRELPDDPLFKNSVWRRRQRTFLAASKVCLSSPSLTLVEEPIRLVGSKLDPWVTKLSGVQRAVFQLRMLGAKILKLIRGTSAKSK